MKKILATPRSFGKSNREPIEYLEKAGYKVVLNPLGKIMTTDELTEQIDGMMGVIIGVDPMDASVLAAAKNLKAIAKYGVGTDNIDLEKAKELGIPVSITVGANSNAVADYTFALMLACARGVVSIDRQCRRKDWSKVTTIDVYGKTLGILGLGSIGKGVATRARGFGMKVMAFDLFWDVEYARNHGVQYATQDEILANCDFISLHLPLLPGTHHLIGEKQLAAMKNTSVLINTARGGIVDEKALVQALKQGDIYAAGMDAFSEEPPLDEELYKLDNLIMGSHCAASTNGAVNAMGMMAAQNLLRDIEQVTGMNDV
ncbi:MAG: phosphoglycerate dehydrogenase [Saezia sp.]